MNYTPAQVKAASILYGPKLNLMGLTDFSGKPLVGSRLMYAISGEESSFGENCGPRFEPRYWNRPVLMQITLNAQYGKAAAMSYGPWQLMFAASVQYYKPIIPADLLTPDINIHAEGAVAFINEYVIKDQKAADLYDIARIFNSGNKIEPLTPGVSAYIKKVIGYYTTEV